MTNFPREWNRSSETSMSDRGGSWIGDGCSWRRINGEHNRLLRTPWKTTWWSYQASQVMSRLGIVCFYRIRIRFAIWEGIPVKEIPKQVVTIEDIRWVASSWYPCNAGSLSSVTQHSSYVISSRVCCCVSIDSINTVGYLLLFFHSFIAVSYNDSVDIPYSCFTHKLTILL